jgi:hypothetical protein
LLRSRLQLLLSLPLWCAACHDYLAPTDAAPAAVAIPVSSEYRRWWGELDDCIGRHPLLAAQFYVVPEGEPLTDPSTGQAAEGLWIGHGGGPGSGDILVRARSRYRGALLKHEMMHAILYSGDHHDPPGSWVGIAASTGGGEKRPAWPTSHGCRPGGSRPTP